jgi:hypothetical protein
VYLSFTAVVLGLSEGDRRFIVNRTFQVKFTPLLLKHLVLTPLFNKDFIGMGVKAKTREGVKFTLYTISYQ